MVSIDWFDPGGKNKMFSSCKIKIKTEGNSFFKLTFDIKAL
jgi:hypothetical protein